MANRRRVQARVLALQRSAVERLMLLEAAARSSKMHRVLVPLAISVDVVGIEAGGGQRAVPASEQPWLQRCERRLAQLVAALALPPTSAGPRLRAWRLLISAMIAVLVQRGRRTTESYPIPAFSMALRYDPK